MQTPGEMNVQLRLQLSHGQQQLRSPQQWVVEAFLRPLHSTLTTAAGKACQQPCTN